MRWRNKSPFYVSPFYAVFCVVAHGELDELFDATFLADKRQIALLEQMRVSRWVLESAMSSVVLFGGLYC